MVRQILVPRNHGVITRKCKSESEVAYMGCVTSENEGVNNVQAHESSRKTQMVYVCL